MNYFRLTIATGLIFSGALSADAQSGWTPGANPKPQEVLTAAAQDAAAGRYEDAVAKQVWFYENALVYDPAMYGVRLSFALTYWVELGARYPPALAELRVLRDEAGEIVRDDGTDAWSLRKCTGKSAHDAFVDYAAINRFLGEQSRTSDMFIWLDAHQPLLANSEFFYAEPALIETKQYKLCGKYLEPDTSYQRALGAREASMKAMSYLGGDQSKMKFLTEINDKIFSNQVGTLVALLVLNDRKQEAREVVAEARKALDDPDFNAKLVKALDGEIPAAWP